MITIIIMTFGSGYWYASSEIEPVIEIQEKIVEKIVTKEVEVEKIVYKEREIKKAKKTITISEKPTGEKVTQIIEEKNETTDKGLDKNSKTEKTSQKLKETKKQKKQLIKKPNYRFGAFARTKLSFTNDRNFVYGASIDYRLFGPIWSSLDFSQGKDISLGISLEF